jgi:hypothetical protein
MLMLCSDFVPFASYFFKSFRKFVEAMSRLVNSKAGCEHRGYVG